MHKELKPIMKALKEQGFVLWTRASGNIAVYKGEEYVTTFSAKPNDWRGWKNSLAAAKRRGFIWPPPRE